MATGANGNGKRRRLPDSIEQQLGDFIAFQLRIEGEVQAIFRSLDSGTARHLQSRFENILEYTELTRDGLIKHGEELKDLLKERREQDDNDH